MPDGVIAGGWDYVIPAYIITVAAFVGYFYSLLKRESAARREKEARDV